MKIVFEDGDEVFYEGERCVVRGNVKQVNGVDGVHVLKPNGDLVLAPTTVLQTYDGWLLGECIELLNGYEQWEANLTTDESDDILETMSTENYEMMLRLQRDRNDIGKALAQRNKGKN
jgi:hypothetical protein